MWRQRRLDLSARQPVWAPIRYGRFAQKRKTYTMVFSRLCYGHRRLGIAQVVPCVRLIRSPNDLIEEAGCLAHAEGLNEWTWGAIGILTKPQATIPMNILMSWKAYFVKNAKNCEVFSAHTRNETGILNRNGFLNIHWPTLVSDDTDAEPDLLLATVTAPTLKRSGGGVRRYARAREIGETYAKKDPKYFVQNVLHGIRTNQDMVIWNAMVRAQPGWADKYANVGELLSK